MWLEVAAGFVSRGNVFILAGQTARAEYRFTTYGRRDNIWKV